MKYRRIDLPEVKQYYWASEDGEIWNVKYSFENFDEAFKKKDFYRHNKDRGDRLTVKLRLMNGTAKHFSAAFVICATFNGPRPEKYFCIAFRDGNPDNIIPGNVYWKLKENIGFYDILYDHEFKLWQEKIGSMPADKWNTWNEWAHKKLEEKGYILNDEAKREKFFKEIFKVKDIKIVESPKFEG